MVQLTEKQKKIILKAAIKANKRGITLQEILDFYDAAELYLKELRDLWVLDQVTK